MWQKTRCFKRSACFKRRYERGAEKCVARLNILTDCAATYLAARALSPLSLGLCRTTGPWLYFQMCAIAQLTKMLIKQQLTGAEKRTYEAVSDQGPVWVQSEPIFQGSWKAFLKGQICSNYYNMLYWERILQKIQLITCFRRFYQRPNHLAQYIPI